MTIEIEALTAFSDNYIWLIKNITTHCVIAVDPGDAKPVLDWLQKNNEWQLTDIFITHHHQDHIGGLVKLVEKTNATVYAPNSPAIPVEYTTVTDNQIITVFDLYVQIIAVPGHTLDHVVYYIPKQDTIAASLLSGDTLFSGGCGRVFEGTMEQMYNSLKRLNKLPLDTLIYPAHEYTVNNLQFALAVEPQNKIISKHLDKCIKLRADNQITLPTTLSLEQQINPFLRCDEPSVVRHITTKLKRLSISSIEIFSTLRDWKNTF